MVNYYIPKSILRLPIHFLNPPDLASVNKHVLLQARATLTERGCQLLRKDGLLDEEAFTRARETHDSMADSIKKLEFTVENLQMRLARLLAEFTASQAKLKQRLTRVELR